MTKIEYTYKKDGKLINDYISVEWIAKVNAIKYKIKFAEDESSIINIVGPLITSTSNRFVLDIISFF